MNILKAGGLLRIKNADEHRSVKRICYLYRNPAFSAASYLIESNSVVFLLEDGYQRTEEELAATKITPAIRTKILHKNTTGFIIIGFHDRLLQE